MASKGLSLEDIMAAITANSQRAEVLAAEQESRLMRHVANSRDEVLQLVSGDIDSAVADVRADMSQQVKDVRDECVEHQLVTKKDIESAKSTAASAVASVDDLRAELAEKEGALVGRVRGEELTPAT